MHSKIQPMLLSVTLVPFYIYLPYVAILGDPSGLTEIWTRHLSYTSPEHYFCASPFSLHPTLIAHINHGYKGFSIGKSSAFQIMLLL